MLTNLVLFFYRYKYDVDKNMTIIKIVDADDYPIGMIR